MATGSRLASKPFAPARAGRPGAARVRRYWASLQRERIPRLVGLAAVLLLVGATAVYVVEQSAPDRIIASFDEALWYAIVSMTTVGYGDFVPKTAVGRLFGTLLVLGGFTLLSLITANVASVLVAERIKEERGLETISLKDHVLICGWNQYCDRVLQGLLAQTRGAPEVVLVNELPEETAGEVLSHYRSFRVHYIRGDPAFEGTLERANVKQARAAIVLADTARSFGAASDERTTLVTLALKSMKPDIKVTAEALDLRSEAHLRRAGADEIVVSGEFNGFLLSSAAVAPGISDVVRRLLSLEGGELRREPIPTEFVGQTFGELFHALYSRQGFITVALVRESRGLTLDDLLTDDISLVDTFINNQFREAGAEYLRFEEGATRVVVNPADTYIVSGGDAAIGIPRGS